MPLYPPLSTTWIALELIPDLGGEKPTTDHLNARVFCLNECSRMQWKLQTDRNAFNAR